MLLSDIHGRHVLTGKNSTTGETWKQFELDYLFEDMKEKCFICGKVLEFGWVNTANPEQQVCDDEVIYSGMRPYLFPEEILEDTIENNWWN